MSADLERRVLSAREWLARIETVTDAKWLIDEAIALEELARRVDQNIEVTNEIVDVRLRAERRMGQLIPRQYPHGGDRRSRFRRETLKLPIDKAMSHRVQQVAELSEDVFERTITTIKAAGDELSRAELLLRARVRPQPVHTPPIEPGEYRCIVADPPWPMRKITRRVRPLQGEDLDYPVMTLEAIAALDVAALAAADAHLYLWTTHRFLPDALGIADDWGFAYECLLTWRKNVGITPFSWMYDTEHILFCRRGDLPLLKKGQRLSFDAKAAGHSVKPDVFYERVIAASPGPRVEMFARRARNGFDRWSHPELVLT